MSASMKEMLRAGVHFGHQCRYWNPKMEPYIYGSRNKIHIINLEVTIPALEAALRQVSELTAKGKKILFVGTKRAAAKIVRREAERCGMPYVNHRWLGGMLTNYKTIRGSIRRLKELEEQEESGGFESRTKKEALMLIRARKKLERGIGGIKDMGGLPDALFVIDVEHERIAVTEANSVKIPVIGVVDTNSDPDGVQHVIPGNDDAIRAIELYVTAVADACEAGRKRSASADGGEFIEIDDEPTPDPEPKKVPAKVKKKRTVAKEATPEPEPTVKAESESESEPEPKSESEPKSEPELAAEPQTADPAPEAEPAASEPEPTEAAAAEAGAEAPPADPEVEAEAKVESPETQPEAAEETPADAASANQLVDMEKILACLNQKKIRCTYSAVGEVLGMDAKVVGGHLGDRRPEASWVVGKATGEPTGYADEEKHPDLLSNPAVIDSGEELKNLLAECEAAQ